MKKEKLENYLMILMALGLIIIVLLVFHMVKDGNFAKLKSSDKSTTVDVAGTDTSAKGSTTLANAPYLGDKSKVSVAVVEFSDYECPFCKKFHDDTLPKIIDEYVRTNKIIFAYRNVLLPFHGDAAKQDANAALCAKDLGGNDKYFAMGDKIFANTGLNGTGLAKDKMIQLAADIGLDKNRFTDCFNANKFQNVIDADAKAGQEAGVDGTPGFIIGKLSGDGKVTGELVTGAQPLKTFEDTINKYLK